MAVFIFNVESGECTKNGVIVQYNNSTQEKRIKEALQKFQSFHISRIEIEVYLIHWRRFRVPYAHVYKIHEGKEDQRMRLTNTWAKEGMGLGSELERLKHFAKELTQQTH